MSWRVAIPPIGAVIVLMAEVASESFLPPLWEAILIVIGTGILVVWAAWVAPQRIFKVKRWAREQYGIGLSFPKEIPTGRGAFTLSIHTTWWEANLVDSKVEFLQPSGVEVLHTKAHLLDASDCAATTKNPSSPGQGNRGSFGYEETQFMERRSCRAITVRYEIPEEWSGKVNLKLRIRPSPSEEFHVHYMKAIRAVKTSEPDIPEDHR